MLTAIKSTRDVDDTYETAKIIITWYKGMEDLCKKKK